MTLRIPFLPVLPKNEAASFGQMETERVCGRLCGWKAGLMFSVGSRVCRLVWFP